MDLKTIIILSIIGLILLILIIRSFKFNVIKTIVVASPVTGEAEEIPLKACPFCGQQLVDLVEERDAETKEELETAPILYAMCCMANKGGCGCQTGFYKKPIDAIHAWNTRLNDELWISDK